MRDYIHVSDLVDAHLLALKHLEGGGENLTLNCGHGKGVSIREVVRGGRACDRRAAAGQERAAPSRATRPN